MQTISEVLGKDHQQIDAELLAAQEAAGRQDWDAVQKNAVAFSEALLRHIDVEENVLFPAFEAATGMTSGPTEVMRFEHGQMRYQLQQLLGATDARDLETVKGSMANLISLLELHNSKEERVLYPMTDRSLGAHREVVLQEIQGKISEPTAI